MCPGLAFKCLSLRFTVRVEQPIAWGALKGPQVRGGFISALRHDHCFNQAAATCQECVWLSSCQIAPLVAPGDSAPATRARPFTIEPPLLGESRFPSGSLFSFGLTLFLTPGVQNRGAADASLPLLLLAIRRMGELGIGHGRFRVETVEAVDPLGVGELSVERLWTRSEPAVRHSTLVIHPETLVAAAERFGRPEKITLDFLTPTRLIDQERLVQRVTFPILLRRLMRRSTDLADALNLPFSPIGFETLLSRAETVRVVHDETRWLDAHNYSARQSRPIPLGGLIGPITFAGDLSPFVTWLLLGQIIHVGKDATKGNGWYRIVPR